MKIEWVDRMLSKLTYRVKLVTAVCFYTIAVILLTFIQYFWEEKLLDSVKMGITGVQYQEHLDIITSALVLPDGKVVESDPVHEFETFAAKLKVHFLDRNGENSYAYRFMEELVFPSPENLITPEFVSQLDQLNTLISDEFRFNYEFDPVNYYLSFAAFDVIPELEHILLSLMLNAKNESDETDEQLYEYLWLYNDLQDHLEVLADWSKLAVKLQITQAENESIELDHLLEDFAKIDLKRINHSKQPSLSNLQELFQQLMVLKKTVIVSLKTYLESQYHTLSYWREFTQSIFRMALGTIIVLYVVRVVRKPLDHLKHAAEQISSGNLAVRIPVFAKDELAHVAEHFNRMASYFERIIVDAKATSKTLTTTSVTIHDTAKKLEESMVVQEQSIHRISKSASAVSASVISVSSYLQDVYRTASKASASATEGYEYLSEMQQIMHQIVEASGQIVQALALLEQQIAEIGNIIQAIVKIADQSNLLSLNTAIRAGKTGTKGLGFTVVADKIRQLADQTAHAILDIETVMGQIADAMRQATEEVRRFSGKIEAQVHEEKALSSQVMLLIAHTKDQIRSFEKINSAMQAQATQAQFISSSIAPMTTAARKTTESVKKLYKEIDYLYQIAARLHSLVNRFSISMNLPE